MLSDNIDHRRNRNRDYTVLTSDRSSSFVQFRHDYFPDVQIIQADGSRHNIYNRIYRSDFMKMYFFHTRTMGFCLGLRKHRKDIQCNFLCPFCKPGVKNDGSDLRQSAMLMFMDMGIRPMAMGACPMKMRMTFCLMMMAFYPMVMRMAFCSMGLGARPMMRIFFKDMLMSIQIFHIIVMILMLFIQNHPEITGIKPGFFYPANLCPKPLHWKGMKLVLQKFPICSKVKQRPYRHIPADPTVTFQI